MGDEYFESKTDWKAQCDTHNECCVCCFNWRDAEKRAKARLAEAEGLLRGLNAAATAFWQEHGEECDGGDLCDAMAVALMKSGAFLAGGEPAPRCRCGVGTWSVDTVHLQDCPARPAPAAPDCGCPRGEHDEHCERDLLAFDAPAPACTCPPPPDKRVSITCRVHSLK